MAAGIIHRHTAAPTSAARCMAAALVACMERCRRESPSMRPRAPAMAPPTASGCSARCSTPAAAALLPRCACSTDSSRPAVAGRPAPTAQNSSLQHSMPGWW